MTCAGIPVPSNKEQDVLIAWGAKAERCGKSIYVYLPYLSETQDEKMFKVVTDRERWFSVVMGEKYDLTEKATEAHQLALRLEVVKL
jgi:hypothetical protein